MRWILILGVRTANFSSILPPFPLVCTDVCRLFAGQMMASVTPETVHAVNGSWADVQELCVLFYWSEVAAQCDMRGREWAWAFAWNVARVTVKSCSLERSPRAHVLVNCILECNRNYYIRIDTVITVSPRDGHRVLLNVNGCSRRPVRLTTRYKYWVSQPAELKSLSI